MCKVVLVEDDREIHAMILKVLVKEGHDVTSFFDMPEAVEHIKTKRTDVAILDFHTPNGDCCETVALLASQSVAVMIYSGAVDPKLHVELLRCGAMWVLSKPTPLQAISEYVKKAYHVVNSMRMARQVGSVSQKLRENLRKSTEALAHDIRKVPSCESTTNA
jgi:two-component system, OmpR family, response regulator MtrA